MATTSPTTDGRTNRKLRTFRRIQEEALRLFLERGYDATTVEEVAAAAGVSHMTVFRHFPTKDALVLADEYDPLLAAAIRQRPPTEPPLTSVEYAIVEVMRGLADADLDLFVRRYRLITTTPALQAGLWANWMDAQRLVAEALAARGGAPTDPLALRAVAAVACAIAATVVLVWIEEGNRTFAQVVAEAFAAARRACAVGEPGSQSQLP